MCMHRQPFGTADGFNMLILLDQMDWLDSFGLEQGILTLPSTTLKEDWSKKFKDKLFLPLGWAASKVLKMYS